MGWGESDAPSCAEGLLGFLRSNIKEVNLVLGHPKPDTKKHGEIYLEEMVPRTCVHVYVCVGLAFVCYYKYVCWP